MIQPGGRGMRPARDQGFTLLEMLIALSLTAVIFALLFSGLRFGTRVWDSGEERQARTSTFQGTYRVLRNLAAGAVPAAWGEPEELSYVFEGTAERLRLVAEGAVRADVGGPVLYLLTVENVEDGVVLVLRRAPYSHAEEAPEDPSEGAPVTLLGPVRDIRFSYFGREDPRGDDDASWSDTWENENNLPRLLRLHVMGDDETAWPDAVFPLPIDLDIGCLHAGKGMTSKCRLDDDEAG